MHHGRKRSGQEHADERPSGAEKAGGGQRDFRRRPAGQGDRLPSPADSGPERLSRQCLGGRPLGLVRNMQALEIMDLKDRCYRDLSGGQQQRVLLARALCATRKVILLDEPVAGLDPLVTINMYKLIERINRDMGITVIMVSHDVQAAAKYATHILHLGEDRQLFFGTREDYRHSAAYHSFVDGEKAVHIWKKAAVQEEKKRSGAARASAAAKTQNNKEENAAEPEHGRLKESVPAENSLKETVESPERKVPESEQKGGKA